LTALLALIYFGLVLALQNLLRGIVNQKNDIAIWNERLICRSCERRVQETYASKRSWSGAANCTLMAPKESANADLDSLTPRFAVEAREAMQAHVAALFSAGETQQETVGGTALVPMPEETS
jgi:hypothetical protein